MFYEEQLYVCNTEKNKLLINSYYILRSVICSQFG